MSYELLTASHKLQATSYKWVEREEWEKEKWGNGRGVRFGMGDEKREPGGSAQIMTSN